MPKTPKHEDDLHLLVYMFLKFKGYDVNYTGGRAAPDIIVDNEIPIEIKLAKGTPAVTGGLNQLYNYMKGKYSEGVLFIWDNSKNNVAYSKAKETKNPYTKRGKKIYIAAVK